MRRVLLVLRDPLDADTVKRRCDPLSYEALDLALCYELPSGRGSFHEALVVQRVVTEVLRQVYGARAESVPVFAVTGVDGDRIDDCAREWGATEVCA